MAFSEKATLIWDQHEDFRREALLTPPQAPSRPAPTLEDVARIHRMMQAAGLVSPTHEAN